MQVSGLLAFRPAGLNAVIDDEARFIVEEKFRR